MNRRQFIQALVMGPFGAYISRWTKLAGKGKAAFPVPGRHNLVPDVIECIAPEDVPMLRYFGNSPPVPTGITVDYSWIEDELLPRE